MTVTPTLHRRIAAGLLAFVGALHLVLVPEYLEEKAYVGLLFVIGGAAALIAAARLWRVDDAAAWAIGAVIAAGMAAGFVLSRTVGLPGFHPHDWEASGMVSLVLEGGFLAALVAGLPRGALARDSSGAR